jgi:long-chain acyl-CoA synthetase
VSNADVIEAAVIGKPDDKTGERVLAYVTTTGNISTEAILAHCKNNLTGYKLPKEIHIIEQLPKSSVGKILRKELRSWVQVLSVFTLTAHFSP